jgi:hypothetical protein
MLLFRTEDDIRAWCEQRQTTPGAIFDLGRLWNLARSWYDDRLNPSWQRRTITQRQTILDAAGLVGPFWRLLDEPKAFAQDG